MVTNASLRNSAKRELLGHLTIEGEGGHSGKNLGAKESREPVVGNYQSKCAVSAV